MGLAGNVVLARRLAAEAAPKGYAPQSPPARAAERTDRVVSWLREIKKQHTVG